MKKIFSLVAIAAVAATMFTSCKDNDDPTPENPKAKLTLKVDKPAIEVTAKGAFTVTSDIAAPEAIVISVTSSDDKILTVDPASVTIAKDGKEITGTYTGVAEGKAKIKIATSTKNVSVTVAEVEVTVGTPPAPGADIQQLTITTPDWPGFEVYTEDESIYFNFFEVSFEPNVGSICMDLKTGILGLGTLSEAGNLFLAPQVAGTLIKIADMKAPTAQPWYPFIWSSQLDYTTLATGEDVYVAIACGEDPVRTWAKINLKATGGWSSLNVIEAYACFDDSEFKVGQKE